MSIASSSTPLISLDGVAVDIIGTALDSRAARIIQVAALKIKGQQLLDDQVYETLVNPGVPIPRDSSAAHGLGDDDVASAPGFASVVAVLDHFIDGGILVGHNVDYDLTLLRTEHERIGRMWRAPRAVDVGLLARIAAPTLSNYGLRQLCEWLRVPVEASLSARCEAQAVAKVYAALVPLLRAKNIRTLAEAEAASRDLSENRLERIGVGGAADGDSHEASKPLVRLDSYPYRHRIREVMSSPPVYLPADACIRDAVGTLLKKKVSSVYIRDRDGQLGIVTERDVLRAIDKHQSAALDMPLAGFAMKPLQTISENAFLYRAIGRMDRLGFRHLAVRNDRGEIVGSVTTRNLLKQRATTAIMLGDEIDAAVDVSALAGAWSKLPVMAKSLVEEDVDPRTVAAVASSEICLLTRRAAQLSEASMLHDGWGAPPCRHAVMVLGSAGRGESLLAADQDNAIVYATGEEGGLEDKWFEELGKRMAEVLDSAGVPFCKGGIMAKNALWRHSIDGWKRVIRGWVGRQRPEDLLNVDIFFDGIPVHGDATLAETVWSFAYDVGHAAPDFVKLLTELARQWHAPFGLFGGIKTDHGRADLKIGGLMPIFAGARTLSIRHDIRAHSTPDRLRGLALKGIGAQKDIDAVIDAHRIILGAVLDQQLIDTEQGIALSTKVDIERLDKLTLQTLKDALHKVDLMASMVGEGRL
jgi:DNA polymerase-3 subunit epsilon/CBS domain-containing protein